MNVDLVEERSLSTDVMPLITKSCGGCHARTNTPFPLAVANRVYYENTEDLLALQRSFILSIEALKSGFVCYFAARTGPMMHLPEMDGAMAEEDIAVVMDWIDEGAKDN
jgi:hypothetical protein